MSMLFRAVLIGFALVFLTPVALMAILPSMARSALKIDISGAQSFESDYRARDGDIRICSAIVPLAQTTGARAFREPEAACALCASLLAAVPDPVVNETDPPQIRIAVRNRARLHQGLRAELSERNDRLARAFAARERAVAAFEGGQLAPTRAMIDVKSSIQCGAP